LLRRKIISVRLAAGGQKGVEKSIENLKNELNRDMKLMGVTKISDLNRDKLRFF